MPLRKLLILLHRWLGTCFCLLFVLWFFSGMVLAYWDYPEVTDQDRMAHAAPINPSRVRLTPDQAYARLQLDGPPSSAVLLMFDGRPAYRFDDALVYADTGDSQQDFPPDLTRRIASTWVSHPAEAASRAVVDSPDQWTVSGEFAPLRPLDKYTWPEGQQVYVSEVNGEVVQSTTPASRLGAYLGAIPHWLYFTPLRRNGLLWSRIVIWASGIGAAAAALGLIIGIWITLPSQRVPYSGQKRWHAILGLIFGFFACTWAFSGMLSMEPFAFSAGPRRLGGRIERAMRKGAFTTLEQALTPGAKIVDLNAQAGNREAILNVVRDAVQPASIAETRVVTQYEAYYLDRHGQHPLPALFVRLNDSRGSMFYIDPATARIVEAYDSASRWNRWLYHGLHSLDLPWLYAHRPAWDIAILTLLLGGASLSITSLLLAWRVLRRTLRI
jgi:uncharacterized iron-regulated membrane protein